MDSAAATTWPGTLASSTTCYPGETDANWPELYASLTYGVVTGKIWYSNEFGGFSNDSALYYELGAGWELPANFGLNAHIGYSDGDGINDAYAGNVDDYIDWSVGVTYTLGNFDAGSEVRRRQRSRGLRRNAGRHQQQRGQGGLLRVDDLSLGQRVTQRFGI